MRAVIQRVSRASVSVNGEMVGSIGGGLVVLVGVSTDDSTADARTLGTKIAGLRVFPDNDGLMNRDLSDVGGEILLISQFTLYGDARRGRRPSFTRAAQPESAVPLIDELRNVFREHGLAVADGRFGAHMEVELVNNGPVTLVLETVAGKLL
jgi:D-tyrosyl-tRNA(Tyr) deacylase